MQKKKIVKIYEIEVQYHLNSWFINLYVNKKYISKNWVEDNENDYHNHINFRVWLEPYDD